MRKKPTTLNILQTSVLATSLLACAACSGTKPDEEIVPKNTFCSFPGDKFAESALYKVIEDVYGDKVWITSDGKFCTEGIEMVCGLTPKGVTTSEIYPLAEEQGLGVLVDPETENYCLYIKK